MNRFGGVMKIASASLAAAIVCVALPITTATAAESRRGGLIENNPNYKPPVDDGNLVRVPNSTAGYTWTQLRTQFIAPIWHPGDHGPLPDIVAEAASPTCSPAGIVIARRPRGSGKRRPRGPSEKLHHPANG